MLQSQNAVSAYFTSKQILPFGFAEQWMCAEQCVCTPFDGVYDSVETNVCDQIKV